jgi:LPPG:FO 2-phospho-L-lactate transferase
MPGYRLMTQQTADSKSARVLCLSGGIGGAKLALGLYRVLDPWELAVLSNTGDDFEHFGLYISPDLDTVMYTLAGESNIQQGWGRAEETWTFMEQMRRLGGASWFSLGDGDLAFHVHRTELLRAGKKLSEVTAELCRHLDVRACVLPMSDDPVRTIVVTADGRDLMFQHYLVRDLAEPVAREFRFVGADQAQPNPDLLAALQKPDLEAIVICPSNPYVSIDPILAVPGIRDALKACEAPIVAVSPIVGGQAIKGPLAKMMAEQQLPVNALTIAGCYQDLLSGFVLDTQDAGLAAALQIPVHITNTVMLSLQDRENLAQTVLEFARGLRK